ncbi:hypothetical protein CUJ89_08545 [Burkholderia pyrrocinia]|uniref:Winged helix-turn-helix domain-containing protein n=1 Tax=Burkholderia pyrrocinia TaxID=60550 RepID=A0A2Z5MT92_BURPY|nr:hypothetical protein [Burkholderia pyrrocinia]AXF20523.1 hypothetical protein CUJ89_08545 [Burkholderia pyrrocinia]
MADEKVGKVGPISKQIIECVKANPGAHASEVARLLGMSQGGGPRETIRNLISSGYLVRGKQKVVPGSKGHAVSPLHYTGKPFEIGYDSTGSERWQRIQQRIAADIERERRLAESAVWAGKAIRAMVDVGRASA